MAFEKQAPKTPSTIGNLTIILRDPDGVVANRHVRFSVDVMDQDGQVLRTLDGDLAPHITAGQRTALSDFLTLMRAQAASQIL